MTNNTQHSATGQKEVKIEALQSALYELGELNGFIVDTSRLLRDDEEAGSVGIISPAYRTQLCNLIEMASNKMVELHEVIQRAVGIKLRAEHNPKINLLVMPTENNHYYNFGKIPGLLGEEY